MSEISQIKQRFLQYIDYKQYNQQEIFEKMGFSKWNFTGKSLKSELGGDSIREISQFFPEISLYWLVLGEGPMLRDEQPCFEAPPADRDEIISLLREKIADKERIIADKERIIALLEEKIESMGGNSTADSGAETA